MSRNASLSREAAPPSQPFSTSCCSFWAPITALVLSNQCPAGRNIYASHKYTRTHFRKLSSSSAVLCHVGYVSATSIIVKLPCRRGLCDLSFDTHDVAQEYLRTHVSAFLLDLHHCAPCCRRQAVCSMGADDHRPVKVRVAAADTAALCDTMKLSVVLSQQFAVLEGAARSTVYRAMSEARERYSTALADRKVPIWEALTLFTSPQLEQ